MAKVPNYGTMIINSDMYLTQSSPIYLLRYVFI